MKKYLLLIPLLFSWGALAIEIGDFGVYTVTGTLLNGETNHPGKKPEGAIPNGSGYSGLLLDEPLNLTQVTRGMNKTIRDQHPVLKLGLMEHIQLDLFNPQNAKAYRDYYGKRVMVQCEIDFSGRLYTPVYCNPLRILKL